MERAGEREGESEDQRRQIEERGGAGEEGEGEGEEERGALCVLFGFAVLTHSDSLGI